MVLNGDLVAVVEQMWLKRRKKTKLNEKKRNDNKIHRAKQEQYAMYLVHSILTQINLNIFCLHCYKTCTVCVLIRKRVCMVDLR